MRVSAKGLQRPIGSAFSSRLAAVIGWRRFQLIGFIDQVNEPSAAAASHTDDDVKYSKCVGGNPIVESHGISPI